MSIDITIPGYELLEVLGEGGMARVYLGVDSMLDRKVAIKVMHRALSIESEEFKQRFFQEGRVLAKLEHPNIVRIYTIGESDGLLYMAMEYVDGGTLADRLKTEQLTIDEAIQICAQVGLALHTTHLRNIVHRDLKPSNVLLRGGYVPVLTDFGIARQADADTGLTQTGHIVGTMQYMSPEQIRGLHVDHRSDIYSLGLMFYRLLVGRLPFIASGHYELSRMQCEEPPPPLPEHMAELQPVMDAMLAKDPEDRFSSALEFCKVVESLSTTNESYRTELTQATRIFDSSRASYPSMGSERFSTGGYSTGRTGPHSGRTGPVTSSSGRTAAPVEATRIMSREIPVERKGRGKLFAAIGGVVAAVLIAVGAWYYFSQDMGLSDSDLRKIEAGLVRVNGYLATNQLDAPPGENAVDVLRRVMEISDSHPDVVKAARAVASQYDFNAGILLDKGDLEGALAEIRKGLEIVPDFEELQQLESDLSTRITEQKTRAEVEALYAAAERHMRSGQLVQPQGENAYEAYKRILAIQPAEREANKGLEAILTELLKQAQAALDAGDLDSASSQASQAGALFPQNIRVAQFSSAIEASLRERQEEQEVQQFLGQARQQLADDQLVSPESDNALKSFVEVLNRRPDHPEALRGLATIASRFSERAAAAMQQGDFREAVMLANNGLKAMPDDARLLQIQDQATGQLGARDREIQTALQQAQRMVQSGKFLPPGDNALDLFKRADELDPGNAQAASGLALLPDQVFEEARQLQNLGSLRSAAELVEAARKAFPGQARFAELGQSVQSDMANLERQQLLRDLLEASGRAVAVRPMTLEAIDRAVTALEGVYKEFPGDLTAASQEQELIAAIGDEARKVSRGGNEEVGFVLLTRALTAFEGNATLLQVQGDLQKARDDRLAEEARQRAALMGQLAIDAVPWGIVEEIRDAQGEAQSLPQSTATPLIVSLMQGRYTVLVRNDNSAQPLELSVNVTAQGLSTTTAEFKTMTADEYFERSGW